MRVWMIVGAVLVVIGLIGLIFGGIPYSTRTSVLDFGGMKIQAQEKQALPLSPYVSLASLAAGVIVAWWGRRKRAP